MTSVSSRAELSSLSLEHEQFSSRRVMLEKELASIKVLLLQKKELATIKLFLLYYKNLQVSWYYYSII
jgi:hypothetical protein